jgi:cytochrome b pre-mRNA-processing protein 3
MKIFKEQWSGLGLAMDLAMVHGDAEMAATIWRNLLGARGANGISFNSDPNGGANSAFRRSVNLHGGEVVNVDKVDFEKEARTDDGSGVHDFSPGEVDKYLEYPEVMNELVAYVRRELVRLAQVKDEDILKGDYQVLKFRNVK